MSWLRIDDGFAENPKVADLTDKAFRLHVSALCYCARNLTNGLLTVRATKSMCAFVGASRRHVVELRDAGLWIAHEEEWEINDYLRYNPDADTAKALKEARSEAGKRGANKRWSASTSDSTGASKPDSKSHSSSHGKSHSKPHMPRPVPSPEKQEPLAAAAPPRKRDPDYVWEAVLDVCGIDQQSLTKSGRGSANTAVAEIKAAGGDPADVRARAVEYRKRFPDAALTPSALAKHWGGLRPAEAVTESKYDRLRGVA